MASQSQNSVRAVSRREYKVMLDHRMFANRKVAAAEFWIELQTALSYLPDVTTSGTFEKTDKREISFLDTADFTIRLNGYILRRREDLEKHETEYTLKLRSPDRYVAAGGDVQGAGADGKIKFEEDIGPPFVSRFSLSGSVAGPAKPPQDLREAARLFPVLATLRRDGEPCSPATALVEVHALRAYERVLKGPEIRFSNIEAEIALILWSDGKDGRPLSAEFSFHYRQDAEAFPADVARQAMQAFAEIQRLDWCRPEARTKTQYVYRES